MKVSFFWEIHNDSLKVQKKIDLMTILINFELLLWLNCYQVDIKVAISKKYGWNTIVWVKIRYLRHFVQNLLGVKVHTSCKISKFCQHWGHKSPRGQNFWNLKKSFICKDKVINITRKKSSWTHIILIHRSNNEIVDKVVK